MLANPTEASQGRIFSKFSNTAIHVLKNPRPGTFKKDKKREKLDQLKSVKKWVGFFLFHLYLLYSLSISASL